MTALTLHADVTRPAAPAAAHGGSSRGGPDCRASALPGARAA